MNAFLIGAITTENTVTGKVLVYKNITGVVTLFQHLSGTISVSQGLTGKISLGYEIHPELYDGQYEAIPMTTGQTLQTRETFLTDDITITPIPYFDVSNTSGGSTIYIGSKIETY